MCERSSPRSFALQTSKHRRRDGSPHLTLSDQRPVRARTAAWTGYSIAANTGNAGGGTRNPCTLGRRADTPSCRGDSECYTFKPAARNSGSTRACTSRMTGAIRRLSSHQTLRPRSHPPPARRIVAAKSVGARTTTIFPNGRNSTGPTRSGISCCMPTQMLETCWQNCVMTTTA